MEKQIQIVAKEMAQVCRDLKKYCDIKNQQEYSDKLEARAKIFDILSNKNKEKEVIEMTKTEHQKEKEQFEKKRRAVIKELQKIEKKYGTELFRSACNRKLTIDRQLRNTKYEIKEREKELEKLKKGQPISEY